MLPWGSRFRDRRWPCLARGTGPKPWGGPQGKAPRDPPQESPPKGNTWTLKAFRTRRWAPDTAGISLIANPQVYHLTFKLSSCKEDLVTVSFKCRLFRNILSNLLRVKEFVAPSISVSWNSWNRNGGQAGVWNRLLH